MATSARVDHIEELVAPLVAARGLTLYDVELAGPTLRVLVDGPDGVDLVVLGEVSAEVSTALDRADPFPARYTLEVSSPGLERPLRRRWHFEAALGRRARVKTRPGTPGERRFEGNVTAADDDGVTIDPGAGHEHRRVPYDQIERAHVVFEWAPPAATGGTPRSRRKAKAT